MRTSAAVFLTLACAGCSEQKWQPPPSSPQAYAVPPTDDRLDPLQLALHKKQPPKPAAPKPSPREVAMKALAKKLAQFVPVQLSSPAAATLPHSEKQALDDIIAAARLMQAIYDRQSFSGNGAIASALATDGSALGRLKNRYWAIMRSPWDRLDHQPFAIDRQRPAGAGLYPDDLSAAELDAYLAAHPDQKKALLGQFTVVKRDGGVLTSVPYSKEYAPWLEVAAADLRAAAKLTKNRSLAKFLGSRAKAFSTDDYYQSDKDWMDVDSEIEVTIGPYEQYEDELKGQKTAFEAFVTLADAEASKKLAKYQRLLPEMQNNLPLAKEMKPKRGGESPIRMVDLVFSAGDARRGVMTTAFNLPNDERVRREKGAKKVILRNVLDAKFDSIMRPIAERILDPAQRKYLTSEAFLNEVLFHELSHSLGPSKARREEPCKKPKKDKTGAQERCFAEMDIPVALEELHGAIEEAKADVMGAYNVLFMVQKKELPAEMREQLLVTYFAGLFRSVRFGVDAHGRGAAMQINRYLDEGAASFDPASGRLRVDFDKLEKSIASLTADLCAIESRGDKAAAHALLDKFGVASPAIAAAQKRTAEVPVDLVPSYPLAGETAPGGPAFMLAPPAPIEAEPAPAPKKAKAALGPKPPAKKHKPALKPPAKKAKAPAQPPKKAPGKPAQKHKKAKKPRSDAQ